MAVEGLGQKNYEIGSDPYLDFSAPNIGARPSRIEGIRGGSATPDSTARAVRSPDGLFQTG